MDKQEPLIDAHRKAAVEAPVAAPETWRGWVPRGDQIDNLFDELESGFWRRPFLPRFSLQEAEAMVRRLSRSVEAADCDSEFRSAADAAGLSAGDSDMRFRDDVLTICGEKTEEKRADKPDYLMSERRFGSVRRSLPLPGGAAAGHVSAKASVGVLTTAMPKTPVSAAKVPKIVVRSARIPSDRPADASLVGVDGARRRVPPRRRRRAFIPGSSSGHLTGASLHHSRPPLSRRKVL